MIQRFVQILTCDIKMLFRSNSIDIKVIKHDFFCDLSYIIPTNSTFVILGSQIIATHEFHFCNQKLGIILKWMQNYCSARDQLSNEKKLGSIR